MALNLGVKVFLVLICISFIFSIAPNPASPLGYGYGTGWNKLQNLFAGKPCADFNSNAASCALYSSCSWNAATSICGGTFANHDNSAVTWLLIVLTIAGAVIMTTSTVFPNAFTLFAGVMAAFAGFVTVPWDLLGTTNNLGFGAGSDAGALIPGFFVVALIFMIFIVVFAVFKGTDF
jgi:hypothetical protein